MPSYHCTSNFPSTRSGLSCCGASICIYFRPKWHARSADVLVGCDHLVGVDVSERNDDVITSVTGLGASADVYQDGVPPSGSHLLKHGVRNDVLILASRLTVPLDDRQEEIHLFDTWTNNVILPTTHSLPSGYHWQLGWPLVLPS